MARKQRSILPLVTNADLQTRSHDVRRTAHGWAWKCAYCGQFASSETQAGKYVCRAHGGVTARQRSPEAQLTAKENGQPIPRPPGRPLRSGFYSRRACVRVDELVEQYRQMQIKLDCTDADMLYLRAYQQERMDQRPQWLVVGEALRRLQKHLEGDLDDTSQEASDVSKKQLDSASMLRESRLLLRQVSLAIQQIERGHERLIKLSKVRAETRLKNRAAEQAEAFTLMVERLMVVLRTQLSSEDFAALQTRIERDLADVPGGLVDGSQTIEQR